MTAREAFLTPEEKRAIAEYAEYGGPLQRQRAIDIFHKHIAVPKDHWGNCMNFMSEIDSKVPDLALRSRCRFALRAALREGEG